MTGAHGTRLGRSRPPGPRPARSLGPVESGLDL